MSHEVTTDRAATESNKALVRYIYHHGYNRGDPSVFDDCYLPDFVHHSKTIHDVAPGAAGEVESMARFRQAIPDVTFTVLDQLAEEDRVASRVHIHGTPLGTFGDIGPGGTFDVEALVLFRLEGGKVAEEWLYVNGGTDLHGGTDLRGGTERRADLATPAAGGAS